MKEFSIETMSRFISIQRKIYPLSDTDVQLLLQNVDEVKYQRGNLLISEGKWDGNIYFVKDGLARAYVERDGKDMTIWFASEGEMLALLSEKVSSVNIGLLEDSCLLKIPRKQLDVLFGQSLGLANWGRLLMEGYLKEYEHYFANYSWTNAKEQYEKLIEEHPDLLQKVPLKHIASYLQITPQSLSRIRAKIK